MSGTWRLSRVRLRGSRQVHPYRFCIAYIAKYEMDHGLSRGFMTEYVELHARSAFSFLEGASVPEELIAACLALEMPAMALLDRDGVYGAPRFHLAAKKNGIKAQDRKSTRLNSSHGYISYA